MPKTIKSSQKKYGRGSQRAVENEMKRYNRGTARSGVKLTPVKSRQQAIAIGLSKARKKGIKVPSKAISKTRRRSTRKSSLF